jgi:hypothetical protein
MNSPTNKWGKDKRTPNKEYDTQRLKIVIMSLKSKDKEKDKVINNYL